MPVVDNATIARDLATNSETLKRAAEHIRRKVYAAEDAALRRIATRYTDSYRVILSSLATAYTTDSTPDITQRQRVLSEIEQEIAALTTWNEDELRRAIEDAYYLGYYGWAWAIDVTTVPEWSPDYDLIPDGLALALFAAQYIPVSEWARREGNRLNTALATTITQGFIAGDGIAKMRGRLAKTLGIRPGQTRNFKGAAWIAMLNMRDSTMGTFNMGAINIFKRNEPTVQYWEWVTARDERVCKICGALDGKIFKVNGPLKQPPDGSHNGCRCSAVAVIDEDIIAPDDKSWWERFLDWLRRKGLAR